MKLKKYDATNSQNTRKGKSSIAFNKKGAVTISSSFANATGLKVGMRVSIAQDETSPEDWYLIVSDPDGFTLRDNAANCPVFNCAGIVSQVAESLDAVGRNFSCLLATETADIPKADLPKGARAYAILTASVKVK